jgi:DNA-binding protein HU-beta
MNKAELIESLAQRVELTKAMATRAVEAMWDLITESLKDKNPVVINKIGTFVIKDRAARKGHNPQTGEQIEIKASKVIAFKAAKAFKDAIKDDVKA